MSKKIGRPPHDDILTPAEWRVLNASRHGLSNQQIADGMQVSINAIKYHLKNILEKTGIASKSQLRHFSEQPKDKPINSPNGFPFGINGVGQISRSVRNLEASKNWYEIVLELPHLFTADSMAFFDCQGIRLMLVEKQKKYTEDSILYFSVQDICQTFEQLINKGVDSVAAPHKIHTHENGSEEWMAFFNDLEQRPLALVERISATST